MSSNVYFLQQIANWQLSPPEKGGVIIPRLQRGLVWSAVKMELLWDSIMRGIPIGAFVVCNRAKLKKQARTEDAKGDLYLLDGQQRSVAITMAFRDFPSGGDDDGPILWLDLAPDEGANRRKAGKSRVFWFKVTTKAHPWGYKYIPQETEGKSSIFSACDRKASLESLEDWPKGPRPLPSQLWPREASSPVPFKFLITAYEALRCPSNSVHPDAFWDKVAELVQASEESHWRKYIWPAIKKPDLQILNLLLRGLGIACGYEVVALLVPDMLIDESIDSAASDSESEGLSVLFERLNVLGEKPKPDELVYSVMKALWPELYDIDEVAKGRIFPYRMAVLAIQVFMCLEDSNKWEIGVTTPFLRGLMRNTGVRERIESFLCSPKDNGLSPFAQACNQVDEWLGFRKDREYNDSDWGILKIHRTAIAERYLPVYKLLLLMALTPNVVADIGKNGQRITSLALLISWFSLTSPNDVAKLVHQAIQKIDKGTWKETVSMALVQAVDEGMLLIPCPPEILLSLINIDSDQIVKLPRQLRMSPWWPSLERLWSPFSRQEAHEALLYAQRRYMKQPELFGDYDPSQRDMWETYNRPWDLDHILPHSWLYSRQGYPAGSYMEVGVFFRDCIGNIVAIPFSENRAKNCYAPGTDYCACYRNDLWLDGSAIAQYTDSNQHPYDKDQQRVTHFVKTTWERFIRLYEDCYKTLDLGQWDLSSADNFETYKARKNLYKALNSGTCGTHTQVVRAYYYQSGELFELSSWENAWFCDKMYFTLWAFDGENVSCCPFLSHERNHQSGYSHYIGLLKGSPKKLEQAKEIAQKWRLEPHEDSCHLAFSQKKTMEDAIAGFTCLVASVIANNA